MVDFGTTDDGYVAKSLATIKSEIENDQKGVIQNDLNQIGSSVLGQFNGIVASKLYECVNLERIVYRGVQPDYASDERLDGVCALTGTNRLSQQPARGKLVLYLPTGTAFLPGTVFSIDGGVQVQLSQAATYTGGGSGFVTVDAESVDVGDGVEIPAQSVNTLETAVAPPWDGIIMSQSMFSAFDYTTSEGKTLTMIIDEGAEQTFTIDSADFPSWPTPSSSELVNAINGQITGAVAVTRPIGGASTDLMIQIRSSTLNTGSVEITGGTWNDLAQFPIGKIKAFNPEAFVPGFTEEDFALRLRRDNNLATEDKGTDDAIQNAVIENVPDLLDVRVISNNEEFTVDEAIQISTNVVVAHPLGPNGVSEDGSEIANQVWNSKSHGTHIGSATIGAVSARVFDSEGNLHTFILGVASEKIPTLVYDLVVDTDVYPEDGQEQLRKLVIERGLLQKLGATGYASNYKCLAFEIPGVLDIQAFSPSGDQSATINQIVRYYGSKVTVNLV